MNDYGVTTYAPTLGHLLIFLIVITLLTYPCSLVLILFGFVKPNKEVSNLWWGGILKANQILRAQLIPFFFAWLFGTVGCTFLLISWATIGGLLVTLGIMQPVNNLVSPPLLIIMGFLHITMQVAAYIIAIKKSSANNQ